MAYLIGPDCDIVRAARQFLFDPGDFVRIRAGVAIVSLGLLCLVRPQLRAQSLNGAPHRVSTTENNNIDQERDHLAYEQVKKANLERQAAIKADTEKLMKLAAELKDYVGKTNENILSLDVVKKAEEIEKLAKTVKDKMRTY
ncbi:MAG TPA: hypothetical protein VND65_05865 [Candidatus Binatia bacterium]|nr:hypothetical protein [Candidatus Binatia bacterium]